MAILKNGYKVTNNDYDPVEYYTRAVAKYSLLSKQEEYDLALQVCQGDKVAEEKFIRANLRLVLKIASVYRNRGLAFSDVIEEGNMGLMHAVKRFDPSKGFRFATYGVWWIRQAIERALMTQTRTIRLPVHIVKQLSKCMRNSEKAARSAHRSTVSDEAIAEDVNMSLKDVRFLMSHRHNTISLENRLSPGSEKDLHDFIKHEDNPEHNVATLDLERQLESCMEHLKPIDVAIIKARFGLGQDEQQSLNKIADDNKITRDQVRRVLNNALKHMKQLLTAQDNPIS